MKKIAFTSSVLLLMPLVTHAQTVHKFLENVTLFFSGVLIPFLIGIAFLFFVINVFRFFIFGGSNEEGREKAKSLAIYGVLAFVIIIIFWGIINMLSSSLGFDDCNPVESDYATYDFEGPPPPDCI
jgi:hypothetical protein